MKQPSYYWELIKRKEIERPGVAGPFLHTAPHQTVDLDGWLLAVIERAKPEPFLKMFPCNVGFVSHEQFSRNPKAIRRIMKAGRSSIAVAAATEETGQPVPGMKPILRKLAQSKHAEVVHGVSWSLAYVYDYLEPRGAKLGFVQRHSIISGCRLYLLFSDRLKSGSPYAAVLYPTGKAPSWSREAAEALVDRVFPPSARGVEQKDDFMQTPGHRWYARGYVDFAPTHGEKNPGRVSRITIGYRSDVYWNPLDLLETYAGP
jgi:hypothetical protein